MRILFTGASSFTGTWFVQELARRGHEVVATFQSRRDFYSGVRRARVEALARTCESVFECSFGSDRFQALVRDAEQWDAFCHHAADVTDYKSPDFDVLRAVENNTARASETLAALADRQCRRVVITGSVFENDEGAGSEGLPAFSPYGLSKGLSAQIWRYRAETAGLRLGKFVIPNPFGPFEEPRFTSYLVRSWYEEKTPAVNTPLYVRDNIHVGLLARSYRDFVEQLGEGPGFERRSPSGYVESQGAFARRLAAEMAPRLGLRCQVELREQKEFDEPRIRINTEVPDIPALGFDEREAWDELAKYYRDTFA